jgi:hypothetical protein
VTDPTTPASPEAAADLVAARRQKLRFLREELGVDPYGRRVDGLVTLDDARAAFDESAHEAYDADPEAEDRRPRVLVAGRVMQHRDMGKLVFMTVRDHTGDLQVSVSKASCDPEIFRLAKKLDYGDVVVAGGPMGRTKRGEICVWADRVEMHAKSLAPPPEKWHGLSDPEIRFRRRYVDLHANPDSIRTLQDRSRIVSRMRRFMEARGYLEVETPMMQPMAGGAAARPFVTHLNALDIDLFLRIAPELYLKRLLVGGLPKVFEINRNFRNEGVDRSHNPEFTVMEAYEAFGDCWSMLELTESLLHELAVAVRLPQEGLAHQRLLAGRELQLLAQGGQHRLVDPARPVVQLALDRLGPVVLADRLERLGHARLERLRVVLREARRHAGADEARLELLAEGLELRARQGGLLGRAGVLARLRHRAQLEQGHALAQRAVLLGERLHAGLERLVGAGPRGALGGQRPRRRGPQGREREGEDARREGEPGEEQRGLHGVGGASGARSRRGCARDRAPRGDAR